MKQYLSIETNEKNILLIKIGHKLPNKNYVCKEFIQELSDVLKDLTKDFNHIKGVIFTSLHKDFFLERNPYDVLNTTCSEVAFEFAKQFISLNDLIENLPIPTIAVINGACLGSGLELALACTRRICSKSDQVYFGFPEITYGLLPCAGGVRRLLKLVGIQSALDMLLTGRNVPFYKAQRYSLVDEIVPEFLLMNTACEILEESPLRNHEAGMKSGYPFATDIPKWAIEGNPIGRKVMQKRTRDLIDEKTRGFSPASYKILDVVFNVHELTSKDLDILAAKIYSQLITTRECQSLTHLMIAEKENQKKINIIINNNKCSFSELRDIGVIGAGSIGSEIAAYCSDMNLRVHIVDEDCESLGKVLYYARDYLSKKVDRRVIQQFEMNAKLTRISPCIVDNHFGRLDLVIEDQSDIFKDKPTRFFDLEENTKPSWIFATNTSVHQINNITKLSAKSDRVLGMHFFSPIHETRLIEMIITKKTSDWVIQKAASFAAQLDCRVIFINESPGFFTTRILISLLSEALHLVKEGEKIENIDQALTQFGFPLGPLEWIDHIGIETCSHLIRSLSADLPNLELETDLLKNMIHSGYLGIKNKKGFYIYHDDKSKKINTGVYNFQKNNPVPLELTSRIFDRCMMILINQATLCLEEKIINDPLDGDLGAVYGLKFPPFYGGPFKYIDLMGAKNIIQKLDKLTKNVAQRFCPSKLIKTYASENIKFFSMITEACEG